MPNTLEKIKAATTLKQIITAVESAGKTKTAPKISRFRMSLKREGNVKLEDEYGQIQRSNLWGKSHTFYIYSSSPEALEAVDNLLMENWKTECDLTPLYEDGVGCGWRIAIDEVPEFKEDYKTAKAKVKAALEG